MQNPDRGPRGRIGALLGHCGVPGSGHGFGVSGKACHRASGQDRTTGGMLQRGIRKGLIRGIGPDGGKVSGIVGAGVTDKM